MNKISPKRLLHSKWTKTTVVNKEKHFMITDVEFNDDNAVTRCVIQAVINKREYDINWRDLKNSDLWNIGWK